MSEIFDARLNKFASGKAPTSLCGGRKGIEKESLRVASDGLMSQSRHPELLGSALTNKYITTDFSESLLEFITPAYAQTWEPLRVLCDIHQFTYERLGDELLWVTSMPCAIPADQDIPLAQYGSSNVGQMKTIYRNGLGFRYGRIMQTIAGIHFNYSLPDAFWPIYQADEQDSGDIDVFRSNAYLGLVRNFRRFGWLILYLFGASPALCKSFTRGKDPGMPSLDKQTFYQPFATSLRMSDLGYTNSLQARISISVNSLDEYIENLNAAIATPEPAYEKIGTKVDGDYRQLNVNQLQIENEYYSSVRPKRVAMTGERPTAALKRGGIEYVEIRSLDLNAFDPVGISQNTMRFVEPFLIYCLLEQSPPFDDATYDETAVNHSLTATNGRDPELYLQRNGQAVRLRDWASDIIGKVRQVAELIDSGSDRDDYAQAVDAQFELLSEPERTPSARILSDLRETGSGFYEYALEIAKSHKQYFAELEPLSAERLKLLTDEATESLQRQAEIETADEISLDEYLRRYFKS